MANSPEMDPPGFEQKPGPSHPPPLSESPPTKIESLNPTSPDEAPPGFENPNVWMVMSGNDTWDRPPSQNETAELPPLEAETSSIGNGNGMHDNFQETASIGGEMVKQPMPLAGPHVSEMLHHHPPEPEVAFSIKCETLDPFQPGSSTSETKTLEPMLEPPGIETPMESQTVGPLEAHLPAPQKIEILDPAILLPPPPLLPLPPPSPPPDASEQTLVGDGLGETCMLTEAFYQPEAGIREETNNHVLKPETVPRDEAPLECHTFPLPSVPVFQSAVPESISESLSLPQSPPALPLVSESIAAESSCENLDPLMPPPPSSPPALIVCDMPKSDILNSECDNLNKKRCEGRLIGDEILSEHEAMAPTQPPLAPQEVEILNPGMLPPLPPSPPPPPSPAQQLKCESVVPLVPEMTEVRHDNYQPLKEETQNPSNQEMEMFSCSLRDGTPDMLSFETGPHVNQITDEPPLKKSRNMYETQGQLTPEACQPEVEKDPFVSVTPEMSPHQEEDMEQIDMDMSDDDTLDRSPTDDMGPHGSDTRDSESLEEAPPGYDTIDRTSKMEMTSQDALSGEFFLIPILLSYLSG